MKTMTPLFSIRRLSALMLVLLLALLIWPGSAAHAQGPGGQGKIVFGGDYTLPSGQALDGDLVVFGGSAKVESDAVVQGSVSVFGGSVSIDGRVEGDAVVIGGELHLGSSAVIEGDAAVIGGTLDKDPGAEIQGNTVTGRRPETGPGIVIPSLPSLPFWPSPPQFRVAQQGFGNFFWDFFLSGLSGLFWATLLAVCGVLLVMFAKAPAERVANYASRNLLTSFVAGMLALVAAIPLAVILAITICLSPLAVALIVVLGIALLYGWLVMGWIIGQRLLAALHARETTPVVEIVVGVVVLTLLARLPGIIPCIGWVFVMGVGFLVGSTGLGAVLLSRFGHQPPVGTGLRSPAGTPLAPVTPTPRQTPERPALPPASTEKQALLTPPPADAPTPDSPQSSGPESR